MITKGDKINERYEIIKTIGEGGMANVYLAKDTILNRNVAVKVLRGDLADDEKFVRRFQREALSASKLNHPNIVEMYDVGEDNGKYYIVMEYVNGKTLKSLVKKRGALTVPEVIDIMQQLLSAVICAHDSYIIHRDIKPQNVMILEDGKVKIMDFGIAIALNSNELTQTNSVMGSVHYLPPEQANGTGTTIKSDIYSLGILMYELLIGKVPFKGDNAVEIAIKQMKEPIPSIRKQNPDIPQTLENIVLHACAKNPKNRYDSAREMYDDIVQALSSENQNVNKFTYKYPEHEINEDISNITKEVKQEPKGDNIMTKKKSIRNKILWITGGICAFLIAIICIFMILLSMFSKTPEVVIPDVSKLTVLEAETKLKELGLNIASEEEERVSETIDAGLVIGTNPQNGRTVKEGTEVVIIVAKESNKIKIDDYTGQNYKDVLANLQNKKLNVIAESRKIDKNNQGQYKENTVIEQSTPKGTKLEPGDTIIIYYATFKEEFPDFVNGNYSVDRVKEYCRKNKITLNIKEVETDKYASGKIISQNRTGEVVEGSNITIEVAIPIKVETPEEEN